VTLVAGPARALPNNKIDFIRGQGSDTTWVMMENLDKAFNNSIGCSVTGNTGRTDTPQALTSNPDSSCTPPVSPGLMGPENWDHDVGISFYPIGSGNGIVTLTNQGLVDKCGGTAGQPLATGPTCAYLTFDYARSSRAKKPTDNPALQFVAFAKDGIPWANFRTGTFNLPRGCIPPAAGCTADAGNEANGPAGGVANLSSQQVKDIFLNCALTGVTPARQAKWSDFGGSHGTQTDDEIIVWADQAGSGTRSTFDGFLAASGGNSTNCIPTRYKNGNTTDGERVIFENDPTPIRNCSTYAGGSCALQDATHQVNTVVGIGNETGTPLEANLGVNTDLSSIYYMSFGVYNTFPTDPAYGNARALGLDLGSVDTVAVSAATVLDDSFPIHRTLYNVYRNSFGVNDVPPSTLDYIGEKGWICKGSVTGSGLADAVGSGDADSRGGHVTDPQTGKNYATEITGSTQNVVPDSINGVIANSGFVPFPFGAIGTVTGNSHCRVS
jgi:ABC-type phosphate transport system substrate-binding protein